MTPYSAIVCFLLIAAPVYGESEGLRDFFPDIDFTSTRIVPVVSHDDAQLSVTISYKNEGYFDGSDQYEIIFIPKERRENWGIGVGKSRITRDGDGFSGSASIRNMTSEGFEIPFNITWKNRKGEGEFRPVLNAKWKPIQNLEADGVSITVTIVKKKKS